MFHKEHEKRCQANKINIVALLWMKSSEWLISISP